MESINFSSDHLNEIDISIVKNGMLATVLLFTSCPKSCVQFYALHEEFADILNKVLYSDNRTVFSYSNLYMFWIYSDFNYYYYYFLFEYFINIQIVVTSLQCIRTLILFSSKISEHPPSSNDVEASTEISNNFTKVLIPQVISFVKNMKDKYANEVFSEGNAGLLNVMEESIKTLLAINAVVPDSQSKD